MGYRSIFRAFVFSLLITTVVGFGTTMKSTQLRPTVVSKEEVVAVKVPEVHVSADIRQRDFSEDTRILVVLDIADEEPARIDLKKARLRIEDPNWFGPDREPPSFGAVMSITTAYPHVVR